MVSSGGSGSNDFGAGGLDAAAAFATTETTKAALVSGNQLPLYEDDNEKEEEVEVEDNEDALLEKMLKEAQELALKMSRQQQQQQQQQTNGGGGKSSDTKGGETQAVVTGPPNSRNGEQEDNKNRADVGGDRVDDQAGISLQQQQQQRSAAAAASTSTGPEKEAAEGGGVSNLEDLLRKSEELLQRMRSTTTPSPARPADRPLTSSSGGGGGGNGNGGGNGGDGGIHDDDATPTVGTPSANGIGNGAAAPVGGPPSPSLVHAPMYSPPAPRSVYVVHHDTNDSLLNESDEMSSIESSSLFLSPTERLGSWRSRSSSIPSHSLEGEGTGASAAVIAATQPNGGDDDDGDGECGGGGSGDSEMAVDVKKTQSFLVPSLSTDNNNNNNNNKMPTQQQGLASSRTKSPAVVTPAVSVPLVPNIRAAVPSQQGMMMSGIPNFNTESPKVKPFIGGGGSSPSKRTAATATATWEKVHSAQDGDDDYVPMVDYTTDATPKIRNCPTNPRQQQHKPSSLLVFNNNNNNNLDDDPEDDDDDDDYGDYDYDDDLTDSYDGRSGRGGGGYSMRVAAFRRQQKKNRKKKLRRLIRSIAIGGVALVGLRFWYSTSQSGDIDNSAGDPNSTVSLLPSDDEIKMPTEDESEIQESRTKNKRHRSIDNDTNDDEKAGPDEQLPSSFSSSSSSVPSSSDLTDVLMTTKADEATTDRDFGDNLDNMAKMWTENPFIMKIFDDFEKQIIDKLQQGGQSESEDTQQEEKTSVEVGHDEEDKGENKKSNRRNSLRGKGNVDELADGQELALQETGNISHQSFFKIPIQEIETMLWI